MGTHDTHNKNESYTLTMKSKIRPLKEDSEVNAKNRLRICPYVQTHYYNRRTMELKKIIFFISI
jgi:hypothetical protein